MSSFQTTIPNLGPTASFYDWFYQYNNSALNKLNLAQIAFPYAGDGITFNSSSNGGYTFALSGSVSKNMEFSGNVTFKGLVQLSDTLLSGIAFGVTGDFTSVGVTAGTVVKVAAGGGITLANSASPSNAEILGIAIDVNTSRTIVAVAGKISGATISNNLISGGFTSGCVYFLDPVVSGGITRIEPSTIGQVSKPVILGISTTEGLILPYRGQFITGVCGASGENLFNTAIYVNVLSKGEAEVDFGLKPGTIIATNPSFTKSSSEYYGAFSNVYFKATNSTPVEKILGIVSEYVGGYNSTPNGTIVLKVNTNGSVVTSISNLTPWAGIDSGEIYLDDSGLPITTRSGSNTIFVGNVADNELVLNIRSPSQIITSGSSGLEGTGRNLMVNGCLHLWQRGRGVTTGFGVTAGITANKQYLADKWVMWGVSGENGYTGQRGNFSLTQTDVPGYPKYFVSFRKNTTNAEDPAYFYNVVDDVRTIADKQFTVSLYARTPGGTGTFSIHSIQNISVSGNTYINGITHDTFTTTNSNWAKYATTFIGPSAGSGITNSYSLIGVKFNENGKTFDFAQFILEQGATASIPSITDIDEEYKRAAPYYQRSYSPDVLTGSISTVQKASFVHVMPYPTYSYYELPIKMKKIPIVEFYDLNGNKDDATIDFSSQTISMKNSNGTNCYNGNRQYTEGSSINIIPYSENVLYISPVAGYCSFDRIVFHYTADADTTIN